MIRSAALLPLLAIVSGAGSSAAAPPPLGEGLAPEAQLDQEARAKADAGGAFERRFALGVYLSGWSGSYEARGVGFQLRWEPSDLLGLEVYGEAVAVDIPAALRVDIPLGFNLYIPIVLTEALRIRPLAGLCTMFSFVDSDVVGVPSSQDVRTGFHAGLGLELAISDRWSLFADATYQGYFGHLREPGTWTAALSDEIARQDSLQVGLGVHLHL